MGEVLKFVTLDGGLWKKRKKIFVFLQKKFWAAQNVHKISIATTVGHKLNY